MMAMNTAHMTPILFMKYKRYKDTRTTITAPEITARTQRNEVYSYKWE